MTNRIRADLVGVVIVRDASEQLVTLVACDEVPDGVAVGAHVLEPDVEQSEDAEQPEDSGEEPEESTGYAKHLNADRDEAERIVPASDKKADLVSALEADDAARAN